MVGFVWTNRYEVWIRTTSLMYIILFALISSTRLPNPQEELDYFATLWILQFSHTKSGSFFGSILTIRYEVQRRTISVIYIILFALISSISVPNPQEELGYFREIINFSIFPGDFRGGRGRANSGRQQTWIHPIFHNTATRHFSADDIYFFRRILI